MTACCHHIVARPFGGANTGLNRKEYLLAYTMETALVHIARSIDLHSGSAREALAGFESSRRTAMGPAFKKQIEHYTMLTFQSGIHNASGLLHQRGYQHAPARFAAPKKTTPVIAPTVPLSAPLTKPMTPWGTLINQFTDHTVDHFDRIADDFKDRLKDTLKDGYESGEGQADLADRVQDALGIDKNRATERARTMTLEVYNQAHLAQYDEVGIPGIQILAAEDERMCDYCGDMDGTIFELTDPDLLYPPFHSYCRCVTLPYLDPVPDDAKQPSDETADFVNDWSDKYFDIPCYALGES